MTNSNKPISITREVARMRASSDSAHRYAQRCQVRSQHDEDQRQLATLRLNAIVSRLAELSREFAELEFEVLAIADVLAT